MKRREPALVVGIYIAQHESIPAVQEVEERSDVEGVARRARRGRRDVKVNDDSGFFVDENGDALQLNMRITRIDSAEIDVDVTEPVMDEKQKSASTITSAVITDDGKIVETRVPRRKIQLCFLNSRHYHIVSFKKSTEFRGRRPDPVAVEL